MVTSDLSSTMKPAQENNVNAAQELRLSNLGQLELLRTITEKGLTLRTMVRGFSMRPFIKDQDVVTIAPLNNQAPQIGEIIAFIHPHSKRLIIHRIIATSDQGWILRGDNCQNADGLVGLDNMLGRIVRIERRGRDVRLGLGAEQKIIAAMSRFEILSVLRQFKLILYRSASLTVQTLQNQPFYRSYCRRLNLNIEISIATLKDMESVQQLLNPGLIGPAPNIQSNVINWIAKHRHKIIGFVQFVYHPPQNEYWQGYWLFSMRLWGPYRGLGIGERLAQCVIQEARQRGAAELLLTVFEDNERAIRLYHKLGFTKTTIPILEPIFTAEKTTAGRRRIVMRRLISSTNKSCIEI